MALQRSSIFGPIAIILLCTTFMSSDAGSDSDAGSGTLASWNVPLAQDSYQASSAANKLSIIMDKLEATKGQSGKYPSSFDLLGIFSDSTSMDTSLQFQSDELPEGRPKYIHSVGTVARVKFESSGNHQYTGVFEGSDTGIVRLSSAVDQDKAAEYDPSQANGKSLAPGFGLKFLRDGMKSCNLVAMYHVDGQSSHNFFKETFTNQIGVPGEGSAPTNTLAQKFATAESGEGWVGKVGLSDMALSGQDGKPAADPNYPFYLEFVPTSEVSNLFPDDYSGTYFTDQLATLKSGTVLWDVRAIEKPGAAAVSIGSLVMTSDMFKSTWGDEHLFFQHQAWPEDLTLPQGELWMSQTDQWPVGFVNAKATPFQTEPVEASLFSGYTKWHAAYKIAATGANVLHPSLPSTLAEQTARSKCPFASKLIQRHQTKQRRLEKALEVSLAECSAARSSEQEDSWKEN